jgi:hypothetical protein
VSHHLDSGELFTVKRRAPLASRFLAVAGAFAVFAVVFIPTVISVGSLSDHVGRRPILIGATW